MRTFAFEQRRAAIIGRAMIPKGVFGGLTDDRDIGAEFARQASLNTWYAALVVRLAMFVVWFAPLFSRRLRTFGGLDDAARVEVLEALLKSKLYAVRQLMLLVKLTTCFALLSDESILRHVGAYRLAPVTQLARKAS
jgi:hypothetical protein